MLNSFRVKFCVVLASMLFSNFVAFACEDGEYLVTAYYSPSPSQTLFLTGDYKSEIRLNGKGIFTASGLAVTDYKYGFVAADDCFEFGDKVSIGNIGVFAVLDRGGAIKDKRIDIWMGFGEEARRASKLFGTQLINVTRTDQFISQSRNKIALQHYFAPPKLSFINPMVFRSQHGDFDFRVLNYLSISTIHVKHVYHKNLLLFSVHV